MKTVAALFVQKRGVYSFARKVEIWDVQRDARKYQGPWPVVAHPPCQRWGRLANVNKKRWGYQIGADEGCFLSALSSLKHWGGVLEHPANSMAFKAHGISQPRRGEWRRLVSGLWITEVNQNAYGHDCKKPTWLVYVGSRIPPDLNWSNNPGTHTIGADPRTSGLPVLSKRERSITPPPFRDLLLSLARTVEVGRRM